MKAPSSRGLLTGLSVVIVIVTGLRSSVNPPLWLWRAVPPLELYYVDAYYHATLAANRPSGMTPIEWLYKSAPDRRDDLRCSRGSPGNATDYRVPMQLSSEARKAGWTAHARASGEAQGWRS